ncbi:MAG: hypothetical protein Q9163_003810 [Psora crenata]
MNRDPSPFATFDDVSVPRETGLTSLPGPYHNLTFSSFSVFNPHSPSLAPIISPDDLNCAVSAPNALLGSRTSDTGAVASFEVANGTAGDDDNEEEGGLQRLSFTLHALAVKPMAAPEPGTNLSIRGYREGESDLAWSVWFPSGYHDPLVVSIAEFSGVRWEKLRKVEIAADFGYDGLDWEFCIDDVVLEFDRSEKSGAAYEGGNGIGRQILLQAGGLASQTP